MECGLVTYFASGKGFGFLRPDNGSRDLFFHIRECIPLAFIPERGMRVNFEIVDDRDGRQKAVRVRQN